MFTSLSNNFGSENITFNDYQSERLTVLNAKFTIDPTCAEYLAADTLEITVPTLVMKESDVTAAIVVSSQKTYHYGTALKTWIKDANTICLEKIDGWNGTGPWTVYLNAAYVMTGVRKKLSLSERIYPTLSGSSSMTILECYATNETDWCHILIIFKESSSLASSYTFKGMPADTDCDIPAILFDSNSDENGSPIAHCHIKGNVLSFTDIPSAADVSTNYSFIHAFIIKSKS